MITSPFGDGNYYPTINSRCFTVPLPARETPVYFTQEAGYKLIILSAEEGNTHPFPTLIIITLKLNQALDESYCSVRA